MLPALAAAENSDELSVGWPGILECFDPRRLRSERTPFLACLRQELP
jgi:hypothetical protein